MTTLAQEHDCLLLDLDGTVFRGDQPTPGSVDTLATIEARTLFVTNNASRAPGAVAEHLIAMGFAAELRRRGHQRPECGAAAGGPIARRVNGSRRRNGGARRRGQQRRPAARPAVRRRSRWRGAGPLAGDGLGRTGRGSARHPCRCAVGGGQRRPHPAVRARPAARERLDGRRTVHCDRPAPAGGRQAGTDADERCPGPRTVRPSLGGRGPNGHRHRRRQRRGAAQPDGAHRRQHGLRHGATPSPRSAPITSPTICARSTTPRTRCASHRIRPGGSRSLPTR